MLCSCTLSPVVYLISRLQRPLLIIFDRGMDLTTPLHHTWTYQALSHDVLDLSLNQIKFTDESATPGPSRQGPKSRIYDLDDRRDYFWAMHKGSPFPTTAEAIQTELEEYRKSEDEVKRLKAAMVRFPTSVIIIKYWLTFMLILNSPVGS
jgi:hypothetical protein